MLARCPFLLIFSRLFMPKFSQTGGRQLQLHFLTVPSRTDPCALVPVADCRSSDLSPAAQSDNPLSLCARPHGSIWWCGSEGHLVAQFRLGVCDTLGDSFSSFLVVKHLVLPWPPLSPPWPLVLRSSYLLFVCRWKADLWSMTQESSGFTAAATALAG